MVLEGASGPDSGRFDQDLTPNSDLDPYDSAGGQPAAPMQLNIPLPKPFPIVGPLMGYTNTHLIKTINNGLAQGAQLLKRPMRREEAEALAYNFAKMERTGSYGGAIGAAMGGYRAWATADTLRLPFYKPDLSKIDVDVFAGLKGSAARSLRHALRATSYVSLGLFMGGAFAQAYAASVMIVTVNKDPRLREMSEAMKKLAAERSGMVPPTPAKGAAPVPRRPQTEAYADNMSPQASSYDSGSGMLSNSDSEMRDQEMGQAPDEPLAPQQPQQTPYSYSKSSPQSWESRDALDDMSPTAQSTSSDGPRESAWDRVRRQNASSQSSSPSTGPRQPFAAGNKSNSSQDNSPGDSFSFSSTDKNQAQRDFDARIERERQGKDFSEGQYGKKW
ncbi:hypothetical protein EJ08DRAFT_679136 [Tothia fuscella]|uniref:Uncharacterized protein n=1 Tax=Tothia fuscella TaxID=1048955 RepID=A0A9P4NSG3_9PEZI|nr:hypothetical protein EJ08DRAFT_679136 [Tothia fuscella]